MILEVILTVVAWRKGWGPMALLPLAFAALWGFFAGANNQPLAVILIGDAAAYVAFYFMIKNGRKASRPAPAMPVNPAPEFHPPAA